MDNLSSFLGKFNKLLSSDAALKEVVTEIFSKEKIILKKGALSFRETVLYVQASPLVKNLIYTKKNSLIGAINKAVGLEKVKDIR